MAHPIINHKIVNSTVASQEMESDLGAQKIKDLSLPLIQNTLQPVDSSLDPKRVTSEPASSEQTRALILDLVSILNSNEPNYLVKTQEIVGKLLAQLSRIADKDRHQIEDLKMNYKKASTDSAAYTRSLGNYGFGFAVLGLAFLLTFQQIKDVPALNGSPAIDRQYLRDLGKFLADQGCPQLAQLFSSRTQAEQRKAESLAQLLIQEYSAKTSKGSSDANSKQEMTSILDKVLEGQRRAATAT